MRFVAIDRTTLKRLPTFASLERVQRFGGHFGPIDEWNNFQLTQLLFRALGENAVLHASRRRLRRLVNVTSRREDDARFAEDAKRHATKKISKLGTDALHAANRTAKVLARDLYREGLAEGIWKSKNEAFEPIAKKLSRKPAVVRRWLIDKLIKG